jgi:AcrR family transcriptional regulator
MASESQKIQRRRPRQARSRATWEAIVEAAAQILERRGPAGFNTNEVAERAGVSIGTLYQYFADKHALLAAAARRELGEATSLARRQRALIEALIAMVETLGRLGGGAGPAPAARRAADRLSEAPKSRRKPGWERRCADVGESLLQLLLLPTPAPTLRAIPIPPRRR